MNTDTPINPKPHWAGYAQVTVRRKSNGTFTVVPYVGMPATYVIGSDQYGGKLIAASRTGHRVTWQSESGRLTHEMTRRRNGEYLALGGKYGHLKLGVSNTILDQGF
jgi:hypothetical protein